MNTAEYGEVSEWFKEPVLKTGDAATHRGFESHPLRHNEIVKGCYYEVSVFVITTLFCQMEKRSIRRVQTRSRMTTFSSVSVS